MSNQREDNLVVQRFDEVNEVRLPNNLAHENGRRALGLWGCDAKVKSELSDVCSENAEWIEM